MLWLAAPRGAPVAASPPVQARQEPLSIISGQIRTADDALPIHRARIVLTWSDGAIGPVFTDDRGAFTLQGPANARYVLHVKRAGFVALHLEHVAGAAGGAWDVRLVVAAVLTGRVVAPSGMPETGRDATSTSRSFWDETGPRFPGAS